MKMPDRIDRPPTFTARYGGWCTAVGDTIEPGEEVLADGDGWSHLECVLRPLPSAGSSEPTTEICGRCNLARPCWCD